MLAAYISEVQNLPDGGGGVGGGVSVSATPQPPTPAETADAETNTECAFPPGGGKSRGRSFPGGPQLLGAGGGLLGPCDTIDERVVKRSQTFSPSAAVAKNRYICRLSRSDSDSAMHFAGPASAGSTFGGTAISSGAALQHHAAFQRGAAERRSLRFHSGGKAPKASGSATAAVKHPQIPRTSLDLELDLQAQHSKLETLNDEIKKLTDLKQR